MAIALDSREDGRARVIIERVTPEIDAGRFPVKRITGDVVVVEADIFGDGHDLLSAVVRYRHESESDWSESPMEPLVNDRWRGSFKVRQLGTCFYTVQAWVNHFRSWQRDLQKKAAAGQDIDLDLRTGIHFLECALAQQARAPGQADDDHPMTPEPKAEKALAAALASLKPESTLRTEEKLLLALKPELAQWMDAASPRRHATCFCRRLRVMVEPPLARFSAWYELFPRSCAPVAGQHGTFKDCEAWLPRIAQMGFDVVYLPPVHPIGRSFRKGRNNSLTPEPDDPGSPWAIGGVEGGHKSTHPELGTLEDFRHLVEVARATGLQLALDIAFQCSPDHPYVKEHPAWFRHRPDGSIQYAENPPKKYQDIYPFDFETEDWRGLWIELKSIFEFWASYGVRIFRVDNPHTKAFPFWEWCITELKRDYPEMIFLSEAFTRPKVMYYLAKLGFTQSYNYFPWRNTKHELTQYLTEVALGEVREHFRANLWPNTPDILTQYLQYGGKAAYISRLVLAATLGASYGIYGPAYERCENKPRELGSEEYLDSEKYELRHWNLAASGMSEFITRLNQIRRENAALQTDCSLEFQEVDNDLLLAYTKRDEDSGNILLIVVNLDPHHIQSGWVNLRLEGWGLSPTDTYQVHELLTNARYLWNGRRNYVELDPEFVPAHVFRVRRYVRTEQDFDYYL